MSPSNVEIAREIFAVWARGDCSQSHWFDPEVEWVEGERQAPVGVASRAAGLASLAEGGEAGCRCGAALFEFRDGRVVKTRLWPNHETALAELGLKR